MLQSVARLEFSGKVWPNGQFGLCRTKELSIGRHSASVDAEKIEERRICLSVHGVLSTLDFLRSADTYVHGDLGVLPVQDSKDGETGNLGDIGSSHLANSHRRGEKGITPHGRKLVRCAAKELQDRHGKSCLSFLTLTCPGMSESDLETVAFSWSDITRVFCQKLRRALIRVGLEGEIVGVTEIQEKRLQSGNGYALHLHLLFQGALIRYQWKYSPKFYRELWASVLEQYVPRDRWSDDRALENVKSVKFSCEGYLGKYMSKGVESLKRVKECCPSAVIPRAWYVCTMRLRRTVLRNVVWIANQSAKYFVELIDTCPDVFEYLVPVKVDYGGREIGVGYAGKIKPDRLSEIRDVLLALKRDRLISLGMGV